MARQIPLRSRSGAVVAHAIVDDEDFERLGHHRWYLGANGYPRRSTYPTGWQRSRSLGLHRAVMGLEFGDPRQVDHRNFDKLDNQRSNLRVGTIAENNHNRPALGGSSPHRGVTWNKACGKWQATVKLAGRCHYLGLFSDELEAAQASAEFRAAHMSGSVEAGA